ncbi:MAG: MBL fold metallo-hydrolase [Oscillospiraceae bacterium]|jgi:glyoxylase-like metal-dependent hydrolase (beta-lactamase superfamily II)/Gpi18-like mannosyltransferase|nr:MBL fold metallo-hydrolase [Oscillospiraceae bacterium]
MITVETIETKIPKRYLFGMTALCCFLLALRFAVFSYETLDYQDFIRPWLRRFREGGGLAALSGHIGNYNTPYLTLLALISYLPGEGLFAVKLLSVVFDVVLAFAAARIVSAVNDDWRYSVWVFAGTLALPTVYLNGAVWGQCDSIYGAFALLAVGSALRSKSISAYVFAALSLSFKLQAVFIAPAFAVFLIAKRVRLRDVWVFPVTYLLAVSPAVIAGRDFAEVMSIYFSELGTVGESLNYNSSSLWAIFWRAEASPELETVGIASAALLCMLTIGAAYFNRKRLDNRTLLLATAIIALGMPFFLPHMHDRYFYIFDVLSLTLIAISPYWGFAALGGSFASFLAYWAYLKMSWLLHVSYGARALIGVLAALALGYAYYFAKSFLLEREKLPALQTLYIGDEIMQIKTLVVGPVQTNCYVVTDEDTLDCAVIDPGAESPSILDYIDEHKLRLAAVFITHGHFDHTTGIDELITERPGVPVFINSRDLATADNGDHKYAPSEAVRAVLRNYDEGDTIDVGRLRFGVLATPGHSEGSVSLIVAANRNGEPERALFSGDTLFKDSCGRTDFPGGSMEVLQASLLRLARLEGDCEVYPGHAEATTLDAERRFNYYVKSATSEVRLR